MRSPGKLMKPRRSGGVHAQLKALGLRTYNNKKQLSRPVFKSESVKRLYKHEISALFGILCRDLDNVLDRNDPWLFDEELEKLLVEFGPLILPKPGEGDRSHLHKAQPGTLYDTDLWYPTDTTILKQRLRGLILAKEVTSATDIQALIEKRHKDANLKPSERSRSLDTDTDTLAGDTQLSQDPSAMPRSSRHDGSNGSDSEDSVIGATMRRRAFAIASSSIDFSRIELRLYRKVKSSGSSELGPVISYGSMFLSSHCTTAHDCFNLVCQQLGTDCSFMIFRLSEDMSLKGSMRLDRESGGAEPTFQNLLEIFHKAKKFSGEPQHRSVEVEVRLDMS